MSTEELKDDVDRLFACFKCGISTPESALKERKARAEKFKGAGSVAKGECSARAETASKPESSSRLCAENTTGEGKLSTSKSMAIKYKNGNRISPIIFYGSPHGAPIKRPSQLLRLLREIHVDLREQNKLVPSISRSEVWATFPRQEEALRFARTHAQANVFCYQDHMTGQRRFLVSTYEEFWRRYKTMDSKLRHHYEVIQEGSPCHLYFDLEFDKKLNPGRDSDEMVDILISLIFSILFEKYSIQGNHDFVLELDSCTEGKFSRHLIIRLPRTAFKDNSHVGAFVSEVCSRIAGLHGTSSQVDKLYIRKDSNCPQFPTQLFLDSAVYTRNRCFRLVLSSKAGKNSILLPTGRFKSKNMNQKQIFMDSLICRMDTDCSKLLVCKLDLDCNKILCFDSEIPRQNSSSMQDSRLHGHRNNFPSTYVSGKSPFPALDLFIEALASTGNVSGKIRCWYWFSAYGLLVYSMLRNRYCERIGREHKSNHELGEDSTCQLLKRVQYYVSTCSVMYVVDFQRAGYYQKCYDPDCKGYRSPLRPLPEDVIPDDVELCNSTRIENYNQIMNADFDLGLDEIISEDRLCNEGEWITERCRDNCWWQEATHYADGIENSRHVLEFSKVDEDLIEDCGWWYEAEKILSQIEEQSN